MTKKINITAKTIEEFNELKGICDKLTLSVREDVEEVRKGIAMPMFKMNQRFTSPVVLNVPDDIISVKVDTDCVRIICKCGSFDYPYKTSGGVEVLRVRFP